MKTLFNKFSLIIFIFSVSMLHAQDSDKDSREKFLFGLKVGLNNSNVWNVRDQTFVATSKYGFAGGIFVGLPFSKTIGFQPELLISQKGFRASGVILGLPYSCINTTTFVDIPLLLQFKPIKFLTILIGPQYSNMIHKKSVYTYISDTVNIEQEFNNENIRKNNLGFVFGVDFNIEYFVISGRYGWDLLNNHGEGKSSTPQYNNKWLQITLGLKI